MSQGVLIAFLVLSGVGIALHMALPRLLAWRGVWFTWHTQFGPALVFDSADADGVTVRLLNVRGTYQSVCYVDEDLLWVPVCEYHRTWADVVRKTWDKTNRQKEPMRRALVMGGGGCSFPKWLVAYRPDFVCEVAEIDPAIIRIARERFFVDELERRFDVAHTKRLSLCEADAWDYLESDTQGYDLIVNDAFSGNRPLGRLGTLEGAREIRSHLREGGVYVGNVRTPLEGRGARVLEDTRGAFEQEFSHVRIVPERPEEPRKIGNNALIAWNS